MLEVFLDKPTDRSSGEQPSCDLVMYRQAALSSQHDARQPRKHYAQADHDPGRLEYRRHHGSG